MYDTMNKDKISIQVKYNVLGVNLSALNMKQALEVIDSWIKNGHRGYVVLTGAHGVIEMQDDRKLLDINNAVGMVTPDNMPEVAGFKIRKLNHLFPMISESVIVLLAKEESRSSAQ